MGGTPNRLACITLERPETLLGVRLALAMHLRRSFVLCLTARSVIVISIHLVWTYEANWREFWWKDAGPYAVGGQVGPEYVYESYKTWIGLMAGNETAV